MSYQVIARKWRPQTFEEVTGQEVITRTLRNALEYDRLHHAYLFSGARGVGKTTTARIFAKALNCHKTDKPNLTPCLLADPTICPSCSEIAESRSMDVLEIDAASHTGIDDVRGSIIDSINFSPARDRFKVFIIDEVHQLSKPAFNALLKTLEEPPGNVVFIMATTELHKVPDTILSRCQEFLFRTIPLQKIFDRLKLIADAEKLDISDEALRELARSGEGSMRDAQSNFDQVISFSGERIEAADVTNALGFASVEILTKTVTAITTRDTKSVLDVVDDLITRGHDLRSFCRDLLGLFRDLLVHKVAAGDEKLFEGAVFDAATLGTMGASLSEADLLRFFNSLAETEASLREAVHPRYVLEVGLVKLIEMGKVSSIESILERLDALSSGTPILAAAAAGNAVVEEKKTLKVEPLAKPALEPAPKPAVEQAPPPQEDAEEIPEPPEYFNDFEESPFEPGPEAAEPPVAVPAQSFTPPPARMAFISAEELEHVDDKRLDEGYEFKLQLTGDDLMPLGSAERLSELLFGKKQAPVVIPNGNGNGRPVATAPAYDLSQFRADIERVDGPVELPELGDDPTDAELLEYAAAHPAVRRAIRIFRAKIVEVKRL